jgi:hypothetical protein
LLSYGTIHQTKFRLPKLSDDLKWKSISSYMDLNGRVGLQPI